MTIPIRATNLTAPSTDLKDILETIMLDIVANSTWTVHHDYGAGLNNTANTLLFSDNGTSEHTITSSGDDWTALGISSGDYIDVAGSTSNDGRYLVDSITGGSNETIVLDIGESLTNEGPLANRTVSRVGGTGGRYSMAIESPGGGLQINFRCEGTIALPSTTLIRVGVNPDGSSDDILDSRDPHTGGAANFSGTDGGNYLNFGLIGIGNTEFILLEWDDAIMVLFKNATRTTAPQGIHAGNILVNPLSTLADPGGGSKIRMDGHAIFQEISGFYDALAANRNRQWMRPTSYGQCSRRRVALGNTASTFGGWVAGAAWEQGATLTGGIGYNDGQYLHGPDSERIPAALGYYPESTSSGSAVWVAKYLRIGSPLCPRLGVWTLGPNERYMTIGPLTGVNNNTYDGVLHVPIPVGFVPNP